MQDKIRVHEELVRRRQERWLGAFHVGRLLRDLNDERTIRAALQPATRTSGSRAPAVRRARVPGPAPVQDRPC